MRKPPTALTIAGSDSGGGAGVEADLKTFAALGVHGAVALTAVTAQNTYSVTAVQGVDLDIVEKQIDAVAEDLGVDAAKTGMLHRAEVIELVARKVEQYGFPLVVDPVMVAKSGAPLLRPDAVDALRTVLIPIATVVTPNAREAEVLSGLKVESVEDMKRAAAKIAELGPRCVVVKGGHAGPEGAAVDVVYLDGEVSELASPRFETKTTHGIGCTFSAAIAAELAKGSEVMAAVKKAKEVATLAVRFGLAIGKGYGPVNPMAYLYREAAKLEALRDVEEATSLLESAPGIAAFVPEVGMNVARATPYATGLGDVAAIPGRIVRVGNAVRRVSSPALGASSHLARYILKAMEYDPSKQAAINVRYSEEVIEAARSLGLLVSYYDRREEPDEIKAVEGATIPWGVARAVERAGGRVPDVIFHTGDWGKEPMVVFLGRSARELADLVVRVAKRVNR